MPAAMEAVAENPFSRAAMGNHEKETATIPVASPIERGLRRGEHSTCEVPWPSLVPPLVPPFAVNSGGLARMG